MDPKEKVDFNSMTTFDLAFNLATGQYSEAEKFEVLKVIRSREIKLDEYSEGSRTSNESEKINTRPPLKGSKSEKIYKIGLKGKSPQECFEIFSREGTTIYLPEIYRVYKRYGFLK